jgi:hypothetical protein
VKGMHSGNRPSLRWFTYRGDFQWNCSLYKEILATTSTVLRMELLFENSYHIFASRRYGCCGIALYKSF